MTRRPVITTSTAQRRSAIRWPFRALAALILVLIVVTGGMSTWFWYREHSFGRHEQLLVQLPAMLWFGRLLFFSAIRSSLPQTGNAWPFASDRLLVGYLLCLMMFDYIL